VILRIDQRYERIISLILGFPRTLGRVYQWFAINPQVKIFGQADQIRLHLCTVYGDSVMALDEEPLPDDLGRQLSDDFNLLVSA
jgi:hypothetical protein